MATDGVGAKLDTSTVPAGAIARVEPTDSHQQFLNAAEPYWISLKLHHAAQLLNRGETADSWTPETSRVITTSTINDGRLSNLSVDEEISIVNEFNPDVHVGGDISVYPDFRPDTRIQLIHNCMKNALRIDTETDTTVLPVLKGFRPTERELCYRVFDYFDHNCGVFYGPQYFTGGGWNFSELKEELQSIHEESDVNVVLYGMLSTHLNELPGNVHAAAGQNRWRERVSLEDPDSTAMRREWFEITATVDDCLSN